jgi:hypothetical protein
MATSGSKNFTQTRSELITDAFQLIGMYGIGRTVSSEDTAVAERVLNKMVKAWGAKELHLWTKEEGVLFITPNTAEYDLGNAATDAECTLLSDLVLTQLNGALAASATAVTVDDTTGMAVSDRIGVVTTDKTIHWTTIATIPTSTTLTLTTGLDTAASDNGLVYTYTNRLYKPLRVLSCRRRTGIDSGATSTQFDLPMHSISYEEYQDLPAKNINSIPNQFHYNPKNNSGKLYLFPRPSDGAERIHFSYERIIEDLDAAGDNFDFPTEWLECLTYQLAFRLGSYFGKGKKALQEIAPLASAMLADLLAWDSEITELDIMPDMDY